MGCEDNQKVTNASYVLTKKAETWWKYTRRQMEVEGRTVTCESFKERFLSKYFPADLKRKKEIEFLRLEQESLSVAEYAAKFEELASYSPYYEMDADGRSKCAKFEVGLSRSLRWHLDIKRL
ncbi:putative retrotransposon gag domain-containing protein [Lupinus albus]|uniref:Putative retrotransposon gag domain-containing protein n=1 Tax=Lupinus albus TaxID=3870 RepID=A0A6A4N9V0_LUPAL|nr:putative retrotransposon gag domain-containing protein [Lupinus albus]